MSSTYYPTPKVGEIWTSSDEDLHDREFHVLVEGIDEETGEVDYRWVTPSDKGETIFGGRGARGFLREFVLVQGVLA